MNEFEGLPGDRGEGKIEETEVPEEAEVTEETEETEDPDEMEEEEEEEEEERGTGRGAFLRGMLFGVLLCAIFTLAVLLVFNGTIGGGSGVSSMLTDMSTRIKLREVGRIIDEVYLYEPDEAKIEDGLFKGLMAGLDDRYAAYYSPQEMEDLLQGTEGAYVGIGVLLMQADEGAVIAAVYADSPAAGAGVQEGDIIIGVNGEDVQGETLDEIRARIRGAAEGVVLTLKRGEEEIEAELTLSTVQIPTVDHRMIEGTKTGYVHLAEFDSVTVGQFTDALEALLGEGMTSLVIDLRDNPGGNLDSVCRIADRLLPEGLIVYTENKAGDREEFSSDDKESLDIPMTVLVNENSASASEILAGALGDSGQAVIVGKTTYGKGVVQHTFSLPDGSGLKLTAENYFTPSGTSIDGTGITPDIEAEDDPDTPEDEQLEAALAAME